MDGKDVTENEKKKQYLKNYQRAVSREREILEEIQSLREDLSFPDEGQTDLPEYGELIEKEIERLKRERLKRARLRKNIEDRIRRMKDEDEQRVLRLRYIQGLTWERTADEMGYSWKQIHRIHARALRNIKMT